MDTLFGEGQSGLKVVLFVIVAGMVLSKHIGSHSSH